MAFPEPSVHRKCEPSAPALCLPILPYLTQAIRLEKVRNAIKNVLLILIGAVLPHALMMPPKNTGTNLTLHCSKTGDVWWEHRSAYCIKIWIETLAALASRLLQLPYSIVARQKVYGKPNILIVDTVIDIMESYSLATGKSSRC